ncbi:hypothetical protein PSAB6_260043 [Paraburkholderia sabiae]|nr:hypothetical protein PSAB6_260043 [Paraburkholderia sabiae]
MHLQFRVDVDRGDAKRGVRPIHRCASIPSNRKGSWRHAAVNKRKKVESALRIPNRRSFLRDSRDTTSGLMPDTYGTLLTRERKVSVCSWQAHAAVHERMLCSYAYSIVSNP